MDDDTRVGRILREIFVYKAKFQDLSGEYMKLKKLKSIERVLVICLSFANFSCVLSSTCKCVLRLMEVHK
jgi:hypothetical protein